MRIGNSFRQVLLVAFVFIGFFVTASLVVSQRSVEITQTPMSVQSIFAQDHCSPPCWFGLMAGESTGEDVIMVLRSNLDTFRSISDLSEGYHDFETETEPLVNGFYEFFWGTRPRANLTPTPSLLVIENGILAWMRIGAPEFISIEQVLSNLGEPDEVRIFPNLYTHHFSLFYPSLSLVVFLTADREDCEIPQMSDDFVVDYLYYYPFNTRETFEREHNLNYHIQVPDELWQTWLSSETEGTCAEVFGDFLSTPQARATVDILAAQAEGTRESSRATYNAQAWATVTARAEARLTATATPR